MPIYAYKCDSCGFAKDVLQKLADVPLAECPSCGVSSFRKQLTAAGRGWAGIAALEVSCVPARALELKTSGGQLLFKGGSTALWAIHQWRVRHFLQNIFGVPAGLAFVGVNWHDLGRIFRWMRPDNSKPQNPQL